MHFLDAIMLGIVEGFTEFLPISSTAHLVITSELLRIPESTFLSSFIIAIQLGAIASVVLLYWKTIIFDRDTMLRVLCAFIPTALIGFVLYSTLKDYLIDNLFIIACALFVGGMVLIVYEYYDQKETVTVVSEGPIAYSSALIIGCVQALAIVPGVSRAGATIIGGLMLGIAREKIVEFSFLLAIPTMLMATAYDLYKSGSAFATSEWHILAVGFAAAAISAYVGVRFLISYVSTRSFAGFGWYRVILALLIIGYLLVWR